MKVIKLNESGYEEACLGFSLSYNSTIERTKEILPKYAFAKPGENKFLEHIELWYDIIAPRGWWCEADTYRLSSKQSASTMHTIMKQELSQENFELPIPTCLLNLLNTTILEYKKEENKTRKTLLFLELKNTLPEGFLQRRIWHFNYKTLQNIYNQRKDHRLPQWHSFINHVICSIEHPEFIIKALVEEK
jgi:hypothetical protein